MLLTHKWSPSKPKLTSILIGTFYLICEVILDYNRNFIFFCLGFFFIIRIVQLLVIKFE